MLKCMRSFSLPCNGAGLLEEGVFCVFTFSLSLGAEVAPFDPAFETYGGFVALMAVVRLAFTALDCRGNITAGDLEVTVNQSCQNSLASGGCVCAEACIIALDLLCCGLR